MTPAPKWAANAAPIATPTPGAPVVLAAPAPNPVPFSFAPGTVVSSAQVNSNFYALANNLSATIAQMNGCGWIPGAAIGSITVTTPLSVAFSTCNAGGTGANATLTLGVVPAVNLPTTVGYMVPGFPANMLVGPITNIAGNSTGGAPHSVVGNLTVQNNTLTTVTLTGSGVFTGANTYSCAAASIGSGFPTYTLSTANVNGSQFNFYQTSGGADAIAFHCTGF